MDQVDIIIRNGYKGNRNMHPAVKGGITWETSRAGSPGVLKFTCIKDAQLKISEGYPVKMMVGKKTIFFGYIFSLSHDKGVEIQVTAYDQLRYLKNKDSYMYKGKRADQVVRMLAKDFRLTVGSLANTKYVISKRMEDDKTLFDIIQNALDETLTKTKKLYVLYDDCGKLVLKNSANMKINLLIDGDTGENYSYSSSIDGDTYNQIKITYDNEKKGVREVYIEKDSKHINEWGLLQYYESVDNKRGIKDKVKALLQLYNTKTKNLSIKGAFGNVCVRAGTSVGVQLKLYDTSVKSYMLVEKAVHKFDNGIHTMDLTLRGGDFVV